MVLPGTPGTTQHSQDSYGELRDLLREHEGAYERDFFGVKDPVRLEHVVSNWFEDERNYDGRWALFQDRLPKIGRVLDMAAGCGTFMLYGLRHGYDVTGIEPEQWKFDYYTRKAALIGLPDDAKDRFVLGVGESLPFPDDSFDLVTSWATLDVVQDVQACLREMLRVLKPGGVLHITFGDHGGFFEGVYRLPQFPYMSRPLFRSYLKLLGRPASGLDQLQWNTRPRVMKLLNQSGFNLAIEDLHGYWVSQRQRKIETKVGFLRDSKLSLLAAHAMRMASQIRKLPTFFLRDRNVAIWVTKLP